MDGHDQACRRGQHLPLAQSCLREGGGDALSPLLDGPSSSSGPWPLDGWRSGHPCGRSLQLLVHNALRSRGLVLGDEPAHARGRRGRGAQLHRPSGVRADGERSLRHQLRTLAPGHRRGEAQRQELPERCDAHLPRRRFTSGLGRVPPSHDAVRVGGQRPHHRRVRGPAPRTQNQDLRWHRVRPRPPLNLASHGLGDGPRSCGPQAVEHRVPRHHEHDRLLR